MLSVYAAWAEGTREEDVRLIRDAMNRVVADASPAARVAYTNDTTDAQISLDTLP